MNTAEQILVIIVSSVLAIFLIVLIAALIYIIKLVKQLRRVAERAENVAGSVESAANVFERSASPMMMLKLIGNIVDSASKFKKRKD